MVEHKGCAIRILYMISRGGISCDDKILFKTNVIFDVSFSDIFCSLISGASLYVTQKVFDLKEIKHKLQNYNISTCHFVPSQFELIKQEYNFLSFSRLRKIIFSDFMKPIVRCFIYNLS